MNDAQQDEIVELHPGWVMEPNVPQPVLVQTEHMALLLVRVAPGVKRILVVFDGCLISRFGYPNDEALGGHPLYARGLGHYSCYEVLNSSWRSELERQNKAQFPATEFTDRHFIITFWDSTFECLAEDMRWEPVKGSARKALLRYVPR